MNSLRIEIITSREEYDFILQSSQHMWGMWNPITQWFYPSHVIARYIANLY